MSDVVAARERYAEELRALSHLLTEALVRAFGTVPREHFLGAGPWQILDTLPAGYRQTPDADPIHLYRDVPVGIEPGRFLNNGQPSFVALLLDALELRAGDHVTHVGCGTGYYTALIAEVVGPGGRVAAIDIDANLAARARENLSGYAQVEVICADGGTHDAGPADAIMVNAGASYPQPTWLDSLRVGGRLIVPLVRWPMTQQESSASGGGIVLKVTHNPHGYSARLLVTCMFFPCIGAIDAAADRCLGDALARMPEADSVRSLRREPHAPESECWLHGAGYCLSTRLPRT